MAEEVWISFTKLRRTRNQLRRIIDELEDAKAHSSELSEAIDSPYGKSKLRDRVGDFESRWDDRRGDLIRDITKIHEHVDGVVNGFSDWDIGVAAEMDIDASGLNSTTRATPN